VPHAPGVPSEPRRWRTRRVAGAVLAGGALVTLVLWYMIIPYPWTLRTRNPERTAVMEQRIREARASGEALEIRHTWVPLEDVSRQLVRAVLVAEDYRFREHTGVDWVSLGEEVRWSGDDSFSWTSASDLAALREALAYAWAHRSELRGRSTITQQLAKNLYFGTDRSFARKAMELVVAKRLERRLGKDRILELYLNVAEWGPGIFGAEEAAQAYFGRSASSLTLEQAAALAATLPHPLTSNPALSPARMRWRQNLILDRLAPASGIPAEPAPLPDPEIDIPGIDIPGIEVPQIDAPAAIDSAAA
jgi:monofunctional biosynthetic peptidoglycan transglycosylase